MFGRDKMPMGRLLMVEILAIFGVYQPIAGRQAANKKNWHFSINSFMLDLDTFFALHSKYLQ